MKDPISETRLQLLHPKVRDIFRHFLEEAETKLDIKIRIVQGLRTFAEQDEIYSQGRTKPGKIVTYSPSGASYHNYGLAIDIVPFDGDELNWKYDFGRLANYASPYGIAWGGNFRNLKDMDHFEKTFGLNWRDMLHKYQMKDFIPGTAFINI